jgi:pilus assembly protein CpaF
VGGVTEVVADSDLLERVRSSLAAEAGPPTPARLAAALRSEGAVLGDAAVLEVSKQLRSEISGAGPLEALLREPGVTDVLVNCPDEVWVDRGAGLERSPVRLRDEAAVRGLAQRLAAAAGRRLDAAAPFVDVRLPGGTRLHAVLPPISPAGTVISFRIPAATSFGLAELTNAGSVPADLLPLLVAVVRSRVAFLITGGTGSGKTTVLGALLAAADPSERIVLVEDTAELHPAHPHVVRLEARAANVEGVGRVGLDDLVRQALRMRPDRLVVGEVRGAEVVDLLAALNTGHEGGCGTLHANSAADVPARLEALGVSAGLRRDAVHAQAVAALDVVVHLIRERSGHRRVGSVDLLSRSATGELVTVPGLMLQADGGVRRGPGAPALDALVAEVGGDR